MDSSTPAKVIAACGRGIGGASTFGDNDEIAECGILRVRILLEEGWVSGLESWRGFMRRKG